MDGEDATRLDEQALPRRREAGGTADALDDRAADALLQQADVLAHRGLGDMQRRRRTPEAAGVGDRHEAAQVHEVERVPHGGAIPHNADRHYEASAMVDTRIA